MVVLGSRELLCTNKQLRDQQRSGAELTAVRTATHGMALGGRLCVDGGSACAVHVELAVEFAVAWS
jgi:hypothetical protein